MQNEIGPVEKFGLIRKTKQGAESGIVKRPFGLYFIGCQSQPTIVLHRIIPIFIWG